MFLKEEHKKCFAYEVHTIHDGHNSVLEEVTPGNVHDSAVFDTVFERVTVHYPETEVIAANAGTKFRGYVCKKIFSGLISLVDSPFTILGGHGVVICL